MNDIQDARMVADDVRPLLRRDVLFGDTGNGVFIRHAEDAFVLKGRTVYRWLSAVAPLLDGRRTMAELVQALPAPQADMFTSLVETLLERGFARQDEADDPMCLDEDTRTRFASQIAYIHHFAGRPHERFKRFLNARVALVGHGNLTAAARHMLEANGCGEVVDIAADELDAAQWDAIIVDADVVGLPAVSRIAAELAEGGPVVLPVFSLGGRSFAGPQLDASERPGWTSLIERLALGLDADDAAHLRLRQMHSEVGPLSQAPAPMRAMLGTALAYDVFRIITGCLPADTESTLIVQNHETLDLSVERLLPHPLEGQPALEELPADPAAVDLEDLRRGLAEVDDLGVVRADSGLHDQVDAHLLLANHFTGLIRDMHDLDLDQSPVKVAVLEASGIAAVDDPMPRRRRLTTFHLHTPLQARLAAIKAAALAHAETWGATLHVRDGAAQVGGKAITTGLSGDEGDRHVPGTSLRDGTATTVPSAAAFPLSTENRLGRYEAGWGAGAGKDLPEAVHAALLSAVSHLAVREAAGRAEELSSIDRNSLGGTPEMDFLNSTCTRLGIDPVLVDISVPGVGRTVLARAGEQSHVVTAATLRQAASNALVDLLGHNQYPHEAAVPSLLADLMVSVTGDATPAEAMDEGTSLDLLDGLCERFDPILVDLTTPDLALSGIRTVRVLLAAASSRSGEDAN